MRIKVMVGTAQYTFADPEKARAAAAGLAANAARYRQKAELAQRQSENITRAVDKAVAEDEAKAAAKKAASKKES